MARSNADVVRETWDAFVRGDIQAALAGFDPDIEWDGTNLPDGQIGRGYDAITDHLTRWAEQWDDWKVEVEEVVEGDDDLVVLVFLERGHSKSGLDIEMRHAELYTIADGRITRRRGFSDPAEAFELAGLAARR